MARVNAEEFSKAGDKFLGRSYSEMDCQEFYERCLAECGVKIDLKGSNAWWRTMTWMGSPEECVKVFGRIPKGATLFIWADDGGEEARGYHDGKGNATHIGIKTGRGKGAIHSSASRGCVAESEFHDKTIRNGGWNRVGMRADLFDYGEEINRKLREYIDGGDDPAEDDPDEGGKEPVSEIVEMVVTSENGKPVKMRAQPDPKCEIWDKIEIGTIVEVLDGGRATYCAGSAWIHIKAGGKKGWMMEEFLEEMPDGGDDDFDPGDLDPDDGEPQDEDEEVTITMTLGEAREILEKLEMMADILAMKIGRG